MASVDSFLLNDSGCLGLSGLNLAEGGGGGGALAGLGGLVRGGLGSGICLGAGTGGGLARGWLFRRSSINSGFLNRE